MTPQRSIADTLVMGRQDEGRVEIAVVIMMAASIGVFIVMSVMPKKKEHNN